MLPILKRSAVKQLSVLSSNRCCLHCKRLHCKRGVVTFGNPLHSYNAKDLKDVQTSSNRGVSFWGSTKATEWNKAVSEAEKIVGYPTSFMSLRCLLSDELSNVAMQMRKLVGTKHPLLKTARKFFYDGKYEMQTRGLLVLLVSKAAGPCNDGKPVTESMISGIYPRQRSLAEIIEMINTANLIHKGVVNLSQIQPSDGSRKDMHFGNKMSILSGDFLLANASTGLAQLNDTHVVELVSSAIGDLMEAEFVSLRDSNGNPIIPSQGVSIEDWEKHTFLSSGSLIGKSCKAAMMLAGHNEEMQHKAFQFGKYVALAHQINEDIQPFLDKRDDGSSHTVISAPIILYVLQNGETAKQNNIFDNPNVDPSLLKRLIRNSQAIEEAKSLCLEIRQKALQNLEYFPQSEAQLALENIVKAVTTL